MVAHPFSTMKVFTGSLMAFLFNTSSFRNCQKGQGHRGPLPCGAQSKLANSRSPAQPPTPSGFQYVKETDAGKLSRIPIEEMLPGEYPMLMYPTGRHPTGTNSPQFLESLRINTRICSTDSLSQLHTVVIEEVEHMKQCALGSVNVSSALYRTAALWKEFLVTCTGEQVPPERTRTAKTMKVKNFHFHAHNCSTNCHHSSCNCQDSKVLYHSKPIVKATLQFAQYMPELCQHYHVEPIFQILRHPVIDIVSNHELVKPYDIAISMWSLVALRKPDDQVLEALTARLLLMVDHLNPTDMAHIMWSCSSLRYNKCPVLLGKIVKAAKGYVPYFKACELSTFVWGMCKMNQSCQLMLATVADRMASTPEDFATEELIRILWAFAKCRFGYARDLGVFQVALAELTKPDRLQNMLPQDHANLMWSLGRLQVKVHPEVLDKICSTAATRLCSFKPAELANVVHGIGSLMFQHDELLLGAATEVTERASKLSNQELCMIIWAFAKLGVVPGDDEFLDSVSREFLRRMQTEVLPPRTQSTMIKTFAKLKYFPGRMFMSALGTGAIDAMEHFTVTDVSNFLWGYRELQWKDAEVFQRAEEFMIDNIDKCHPNDVRSVVISLERNGYLSERLVRVAHSYGFKV